MEQYSSHRRPVGIAQRSVTKSSLRLHCRPKRLFSAYSVTDLCIVAAAAPNVTVTLQTALLGRYGGSELQAGFAAVATTANTVCFLFNFLTDGVSAKLGKNAGAQDWQSLYRHVKLALIW